MARVVRMMTVAAAGFMVVAAVVWMAQRTTKPVMPAKVATTVSIEPGVAFEPRTQNGDAAAEAPKAANAAPADRTVAMPAPGRPAHAPANPVLAGPPFGSEQSASSPRLPAERTLMEGDSIALSRSAPLLKGDDFDDFLDRFADEARSEALAMDITQLYAGSSDRATQKARDVIVRRVVCGMTMCFVVVSAPASEIFGTWFNAFMSDPSARPYGVGRHDKAMADGSTEYRIMFSSDPSVRSFHGNTAPPPQGRR